MSTKLTHRITIYVPLSRIDVPQVKETTLKAARIAGGASVHNGGGTWFKDGVVVQERIGIATFWFRQKDHAAMLDATGDIIGALLVAGEKSVMIEQHDPEQGTRAHLFYP